MTQTIQSTRFGTLELPTANVVDLPAGLVGLPGRHYALVPTGDGSPFHWLQSVEDPGLALPVCDPFAFFPDFVLELPDDVVAETGLPADGVGVEIWVTVRAASDLQDFAANLRGPIVVFGGVGHQVLNTAPGAELRAPLFATP